jgi:hypothetical protein
VAVAVRWYQLVRDIIDGEEILENDRCLVFKKLEFWLESLDSELLMDSII